MKKILILILIGIYLVPQNLKAQNNDAAVAAGAGALVAIGAGIAAVQQMKEQVELEATQHILSNFPQYNRFLLKTLDFDGKKLKDISSTSVITFKMREFDIDNDRKAILGKRMVLFAFTSNGWINQYGVDFKKIQWHLISSDEWLNMMTSYSKVASAEKDDAKIKKALIDGEVVNKGVRAKKSKDDIDFYKIGGDMYLVTDYSEDFKFVYNERSFGMYLKKTRDLVQIGRNDLIKIHKFIFDD
tara:strand:+ start:60 stop:788 length:729 start_codon:yes stop_codon:yes gene_type:complete